MKNRIREMLSQFKKLLGFDIKRSQKHKDIYNERVENAYDYAFQEGWKAGYEAAKEEISNNYVHSLKAVKPEKLVLFVKADRAAIMIDIIRRNGSLIGVNSDQLVSETMRIWVGNAKQFQQNVEIIFNQKVINSTIGKEYDTVAILVDYPQEMKPISNKSDSYTISEVIRKTCELGLSCYKISNRLDYNMIKTLPLIRV